MCWMAGQRALQEDEEQRDDDREYQPRGEVQQEHEDAVAGG